MRVFPAVKLRQTGAMRSALAEAGIEFFRNRLGAKLDLARQEGHNWFQAMEIAEHTPYIVARLKLFREYAI